MSSSKSRAEKTTTINTEECAFLLGATEREMAKLEVKSNGIKKKNKKSQECLQILLHCLGDV